MTGTDPQTELDAEARFRRTLSPALFPSWQATCQAFGVAIAAGPELVMLVGGPGSGKTFTLLAYAGGTGKKASLRSLDDFLEPGTEIDLVDNVHAKSLARLTPFDGTRALAVEPKLAERLMRAFPEARIVAMRPMQSRDVRMMVEVRRPQLELPVGYFTSKALARMDELCAGNPRRLDDLLFRSLRSAGSAAAARVSPLHVERAALQLAMGAGIGEDSAPLDREEVLRLMSRIEGSDQPWMRRRANAAGFSAGATAARRTPSPSAWSLGKAATTPKPAWRSAPLLISARKAGESRNKTVFATHRAEAAGAGSRGRRLGRRTWAVAAVAGVALAVTARELPEMLSWLGEGGQASVVAASTTIASLAPAPALPGAAPPAGAPLPSNRADPAGPGAASSETAVVRAMPAPHSAPSNPALALAPTFAGVPPPPVPAAGQKAPASPRNAKQAARLLVLGKALLAINQVADARELIKASADMGDSKAAALLATYDAMAQGRHAQAGPAQTERAGARVRPAARAAP